MSYKNELIVCNHLSLRSSADSRASDHSLSNKKELLDGSNPSVYTF